MPARSQLFWLFFRLSGRVNRGAFFLAGLLVFIVQMFFVYRVALYPVGSAESEAWVFGFLVVSLVSAWTNFALTAKRFHDFGKPTAYAALSLVVGFVLVIILSFIKGDPGPNQYGAETNSAS